MTEIKRETRERETDRDRQTEGEKPRERLRGWRGFLLSPTHLVHTWLQQIMASEVARPLKGRIVGMSVC